MTDTVQEIVECFQDMRSDADGQAAWQYMLDFNIYYQWLTAPPMDVRIRSYAALSGVMVALGMGFPDADRAMWELLAEVSSELWKLATEEERRDAMRRQAQTGGEG